MFRASLLERVLSPQAYMETFSRFLGGLGAFSLPRKYIVNEAARIAAKAAIDSSNVRKRLQLSRIEFDDPTLWNEPGTT